MTENTQNNQINAPTASSMIMEERHDSELFRVYAQILDGITDQALLPGKKLTESDLCRQMVCSRNTVRGALSLLAHDKIVDLLPNRGAFVHVPDAKETREVFETRIALEEMILGALLDKYEDLETTLQPLYQIIEVEEQAFNNGDQVGWKRLSHAFHIELTRLLGNDVLVEILSALCARSSLIIALFNSKNVKRTCTYLDHREILDLLVARKRNRVCKVMRRHLTDILERLERKFESENTPE